MCLLAARPFKAESAAAKKERELMFSVFSECAPVPVAQGEKGTPFFGMDFWSRSIPIQSIFLFLFISVAIAPPPNV